MSEIRDRDETLVDDHRLVEETSHLRKVKNTLSVVAGLLGVTTALFGYLGYQQYVQNQAYQMAVENRYQRAFADLSSNVENMELEMSRLMASNSPNQAVMGLQQVSRQASEASANMGQLPLATLLLSRTNRFVNTVDDFSTTLAERKVDGNVALTAAEKKTLGDLHRQTTFLRDELGKMGEQLNARQVTWVALEKQARQQEQQGSKQQTALGQFWQRVVFAVAGQGPETQAPPILANFQFVENELQKYSPVEYDGRHSEQIQVTPRGLGSGQITQEQAISIAQSWVGQGPLAGHQVRVTGEGKAAIPAYGIGVYPNDAPNENKIAMEISKTGGHVIWMLKERPVGTPVISRDEAAAVARDYLSRRGLNNFEATAVEEYQSLAVVTLVPRDGNVSLYPDKIKVRVAMDDKEVLGYDATAYLTFHTNRNLPAAKISREDARKRVASDVAVTGDKLVLLAKDNYQEILCWEFKAARDNMTYLVYINTQTGREERIFRVIETNAGTFVF
ncbi:germination protein YpeB [Heliobacterium undosum]|uniref:Germination protein YpeB n=1 Tax=Heliomicrobium undosum TaxID=121734 RepID=A0A845L2I9_9FIRM|nr:germination protein YpeB [Heliomicrobium undosum]MZP28720.1 germination protein YpeB [Heliomicrobium undosum]